MQPTDSRTSHQRGFRIFRIIHRAVRRKISEGVYFGIELGNASQTHMYSTGEIFLTRINSVKSTADMKPMVSQSTQSAFPEVRSRGSRGNDRIEDFEITQHHTDRPVGGWCCLRLRTEGIDKAVPAGMQLNEVSSRNWHNNQASIASATGLAGIRRLQLPKWLSGLPP
ncbi:hypothetical protein AB7M49_004134 [Bradyrhizobium elkanii]